MHYGLSLHIAGIRLIMIQNNTAHLSGTLVVSSFLHKNHVDDQQSIIGMYSYNSCVKLSGGPSCKSFCPPVNVCRWSSMPVVQYSYANNYKFDIN